MGIILLKVKQSIQSNLNWCWIKQIVDYVFPYRKDKIEQTYQKRVKSKIQFVLKWIWIIYIREIDLLPYYISLITER